MAKISHYVVMYNHDTEKLEARADIELDLEEPIWDDEKEEWERLSQEMEQDDARGFETLERLISQRRATIDLVVAAKSALADLEGIMPEFEPSGERNHPAWKTIKHLYRAIGKFDERYNPSSSSA